MPNTLFDHVDLYCERLGPELWAEPANALTNLAFVAAGLWGVREVRRRGTGTFAEVLAWWAVAIGIGSALFHTFANRLTIWADVLPIAGFTLAYTLLNLRRFLGFGWPKSIAIFVGFYAVVGFATFMVPDWLRLASNGSTGYMPPFLALIFFGILVTAHGNRAGWYNLAAAAIFVASVTFRAIDPVVCDAFPLGTHFLWHILNGLMLGVLLMAVAKYGGLHRTSTR
ncbi:MULTISPECIES: ceramidase domain-containing protein [unclassified Mesorhizobium]|uniref:ceramidase domain-containing protein n=1 Tax=unclassified Mesorhizobium TaxID=325217 RepID=UPI00301530ED